MCVCVSVCSSTNCKIFIISRLEWIELFVSFIHPRNWLQLWQFLIFSQRRQRICKIFHNFVLSRICVRTQYQSCRLCKMTTITQYNSYNWSKSLTKCFFTSFFWTDQFLMITTDCKSNQFWRTLNCFSFLSFVLIKQIIQKKCNSDIIFFWRGRSMFFIENIVQVYSVLLKIQNLI